MNRIAKKGEQQGGNHPCDRHRGDRGGCGGYISDNLILPLFSDEKVEYIYQSWIQSFSKGGAMKFVRFWELVGWMVGEFKMANSDHFS